MTSRQMRAELAQSGVEEWETAFFRVIQRLKRDRLITVKRIPREPDEYRGSQAQYELTEAGKHRVAVMRGLYRRAERRVRRLRWGVAKRRRKRLLVNGLHSTTHGYQARKPSKNELFVTTNGLFVPERMYS